MPQGKDGFRDEHPNDGRSWHAPLHIAADVGPTVQAHATHEAEVQALRAELAEAQEDNRMLERLHARALLRIAELERELRLK